METGNKLFLVSIFLGLFLLASVAALPIYVKPLDASGNVRRGLN